MNRFYAWLKHAFAIPKPAPFDARDGALLDRLAEAVVARRLQAPALMLLETCRPLNVLGAQTMAFLQPFVQTTFRGAADYERFMELLDRRETIDALIARIERRAKIDGGPEPQAETSDNEQSPTA